MRSAGMEPEWKSQAGLAGWLEAVTDPNRCALSCDLAHLVHAASRRHLDPSARLGGPRLNGKVGRKPGGGWACEM